MDKSTNEKMIPEGGISELKPRLLQRVNNFLFGYDFFISYAWNDARTYAVALAENLSRQGFECFLDSSGFAKGDNWRLAGGRALRKTSRLLLLLTPGAVQSEPVRREVESFKQTGRIILPIDFVGKAPTEEIDPTFGGWVPNEILRISESMETLDAGPTEKTLREIRDSFDLVRQNQKRIRWLAGAAGVFAVVAVTAVSAGVIAEWRRRDALSRGLAAQAIVVADRQLDLAMLLAADAQSVRSTDQSRSSLMHILNLTPVEGYLHQESVPGHVLAHPTQAKVLAVANWDGGVVLWDVSTRTKLASAVASGDELFAFAISPDGKRLCAGGKSAQIVIWELDSHGRMNLREISRVRHPCGKIIRSLHFLDDDSIVVAADEGTIRRYATADGTWTALPPVHTAAVSVLTRDPSGALLVSAGSDSQVVFWDLSDPTFSHHTAVRCKDWPLSVAFSHDGKWMAVGTHDKDVELWKFPERQFAMRLPLQTSGGRTFAVGFSPDSRLLFFGGDDGAINTFSFVDGRIQQKFAHSDSVLDFCWTSDGQRFVTAGRDRKMAIWNPAQLSPLASEHARFTSEVGWITASAFSEKLQILLLGDEQGNLRTVNTALSRLKGAKPAHDGRVNSILALESGLADFVTTGVDRKVTWWRIEGGELMAVNQPAMAPKAIRTLLNGSGGVQVFGVTATGEVFLCDSGGSGVSPIGRCFFVDPSAQPPPVFDIHPSKPIIAAGSRDALNLFDCARRVSIALPKATEYLSKVQFSPDGRELLCAGGTAIEIRTTDTGVSRASMQISRVPPSEWAVAADGTMLCADTEGRLTWWNLASRAQLGPAIKLPAIDCSALFYSKKDQAFISLERTFSEGRNHYVVREWTADPKSWVQLARTIANRTFNELEAARFGR